MEVQKVVLSRVETEAEEMDLVEEVVAISGMVAEMVVVVVAMVVKEVKEEEEVETEVETEEVVKGVDLVADSVEE